MGLDITAYKEIVKAQNGEAFDEAGELKWTDGWFEIHINRDFPGRADDLQEAPHKAEEEFRFHAGSYGGYNQWRNQLAVAAGYPSAEYVWAIAKGGQFFELINFTDCEGVIGADTSKKLAKDFSDFEAIANLHEDEWFRARYQDLKKAFEFAAENGCVCFH